MKTDNKTNVVNRVAIKDIQGDAVSFQGTSAYDASSLFDDDVNLPTPGYVYVAAAGDLNLLLVGDSTALVWTFPQAGIYPLRVKRILSTSSDALTTYILN